VSTNHHVRQQDCRRQTDVVGIEARHGQLWTEDTAISEDVQRLMTGMPCARSYTHRRVCT